ncbi:MAG: TadE family protein [Xanthobacteraceae bacterium]|jgi:Flp pilus assembly protein TadG
MSIQKNSFLTGDSGSTAVEFGLVLPGLAMLIVGTLYAGLVMYSIAGLHTAVEEGARCYSVNSGSCGSASEAQTYAQNHYYGLNKPAFSASTPACGHQVAGTVSVILSAGIARWTIPLSAQACYP